MDAGSVVTPPLPALRARASCLGLLSNPGPFEQCRLRDIVATEVTAGKYGIIKAKKKNFQAFFKLKSLRTFWGGFLQY